MTWSWSRKSSRSMSCLCCLDSLRRQVISSDGIVSICCSCCILIPIWIWHLLLLFYVFWRAQLAKKVKKQQEMSDLTQDWLHILEDVNLWESYSAPSHYLNQCWVIVNWTLRNKFEWNFIKIPNFSFTKMQLKISSVKWRSFCPGGRWVNRQAPTV